jgi:two-component system chemotaxis response regulator CheB
MVKLERPIRVVVVDDSVVVREMLKEILESGNDITVVGEATNGHDAVEKARILSPDLITMDIRMPVMDGLEAVREIMAKRPTPILVITASLSREETDISFQAISDGALDVMLKPRLEKGPEMRRFRDELLEKVRILSRVRVISHFGRKPRRTRSIPKSMKAHERVVAIGASTGGPEAVMHILKSLPPNFPSPLCVVQHISQGFDAGFASWLNKRVPFDVRVAGDGDRLKPGLVLIAPCNFHLRFQGLLAEIMDTPPVNSCKPSVDVMFESLAVGFKENAVGVILTGIGCDGTRGAEIMKENGGFTIAQDLASSVVYGMPKSAIDGGVVDLVLPLDQIPETLVQVISTRRKGR